MSPNPGNGGRAPLGVAADDYAVVIGIARYPCLGKDLQGPVKDAEDFRMWLLGPAGLPPSNVQFVASEDPPAPGDRPVQDGIDDAFNAVLGAARKSDARRLYVYFAGHGCAQEFQHVALLVANASRDNLNRSLDAGSYHGDLARMALFPEQVFFYDCCRNYDARVRGRRAPWSDEPPNPKAVAVTQFVLYAAAFTQYAYEKPLLDDLRGLFTRALLEGLNGEAAVQRGHDWVVTTDSLKPYVHFRLEVLAAQKGVRQQLQRAEAGVERTLDLCRTAVPGRHQVNVTVAASGVLVIRDGRFRELKRLDVVPPSTKLQLPAADYIVEFEPAGGSSGPSPQLVPVRPGAPTAVAV